MKKRILWALAAIAVLAGGVFGVLRIKRMSAAADVTEFTPADVEALLWIPRVDEFTEDLVIFTRGIQEAGRVREFLKPETGVDLGDPDGLRNAGLDPEAGLVIYSKKGMVHMLFGVEDPDGFTAALKSKFQNMGHGEPTPLERGDGRSPIWRVSGDYAAFASEDGLLVLVYKGAGGDPAAGVAEVLRGPGAGGFFNTPRYAEIRQRLGEEGPLLYADGGSFARGPDGRPKLAWLDRLQLPGLVDTFVRARVGGYLSRVSWAAARIGVEPCAATIKAAMTVSDGVTLVPPEWLQPDPAAGPDFGGLLPRDTVLMTRVALNVRAATELLEQLSKLGSGLSEIGAAIGIGGEGIDPVAGMLAQYVHPSLADRHLVRDLLQHVTGHVSLAIVGLDKRADFSDALRVAEDPRRWMNTVPLVLSVQLREPKAFLTKWWDKLAVLQQAGYAVERVSDPKGATVLKIGRGCKPKAPTCEHYGVVLEGDLLQIATGQGTLDRLTAVRAGTAANLLELTKEQVAKDILRHGNMVAGSYFSFDGLLKAIRNRNLPGGATRYLAQMFEMALTLDVTGGDAGGRLLLTR